jgi:hypothetical protein
VHAARVFSARVTGFTFARDLPRDPAIGEGAVPSRRRREPAMIAATALHQSTPRAPCGLCASLAQTWRTVTHDLFDPYRPERHYMRGPGPKWGAKHAGLQTAPAAVH